MTLFSDRQRAESYGDDAERYERTRPSYPVQMVADLMADRPHAVLDVGCGTGKAGRLFVDQGCAVVGVEPDPRMAEIARRFGLDVELGLFENWDRRGRTFDLLISAQAWHWIDPTKGPQCAAAALQPGGRIALIWTIFKHEEHVKEAFDHVYARHAPELLDDSGVLGTVKRGGGSAYMVALDRTGFFERPRMRLYQWSRSYSTDSWLDQLPTHSDHRQLDSATLGVLLNAIRDEIDRLGGTIHVSYDVWMITTRRAWRTSDDRTER